MTYYTPPDIARQLERDFDIVLTNPPFTLAAPTAPGKTLPAPGKTLPAVRLLRSLWRKLVGMEASA